MKFFPSIALCSLIFTPCWAQEKATGESLSSEEAQVFLQKLERMSSEFFSGNKGRLNKAEAELTRAASSEAAASSLYEDAMKNKIMSESKEKRVSRKKDSGNPIDRFTEWRKKYQSGDNSAGRKKAVQIQCKWLLISMKKAEADKLNKDIDIVSATVTILNDIKANAENLSTAMQEGQNAAYMIAEYLNIQDYRASSIPASAFDLGSVYSQILLKKPKEDKDILTIRKIWADRIALESTLVNALQASKKGETIRPESTPEAFKLRLMWEMELACLELGDEKTAISNMVKIASAAKSPADKERFMKELMQRLKTKTEIADQEKATKKKEKLAAQSEEEEAINDSLTVIDYNKKTPKTSKKKITSKKKTTTSSKTAKEATNPKSTDSDTPSNSSHSSPINKVKNIEATSVPEQNENESSQANDEASSDTSSDDADFGE